MSGVKIGVIAEDASDVEVLKILASKVATRKFSTAHFIGKGCGPLKRKIPAWCKVFVTKGVNSVIVVHDRDRLDAAKLKETLSSLIPEESFAVSSVVVPIEELEAWLLSDEHAIRKALNLTAAPKPTHHPEAILSPKEHLGRLVRQHSKNQQKQYVNTIHNPLIAEEISLTKLNRCPSFRDFRAFVSTAVG